MDYRKPAIFGQNWSPSRYQVLPYFAEEKARLTQPGNERILDLGCAAGWNMSRFRQYGRAPLGLDVVWERVRLARAQGPVMLASGLDIPLADGSLDAVYVQHVLHHIGDAPRALSQAWRCLRPGGLLFLVETVEDNPIIHWGRQLHGSWLGDAITAPFSFQQLQAWVTAAGFQVEATQQFSVLFWLWEIGPDHWSWLEKLTPLFVRLERRLARRWRRYGAHCFVAATKPMASAAERAT